MPEDNSGGRSTEPQRQLADYCLWWPLGAAPCYARAGFVLVRPAVETLGFSCARHLEAWRAQIVGEYEARTLREWEAPGCGYRGPAWEDRNERMLGRLLVYAARLVDHLRVILWDGIGRDRITVRGAQALLVCLLGCTAGGSSPAPVPRLVVDTIDAPAIAANLYEDPPRVPVAVYLPPSYAASPRRSYPVLYVLHGYTYTLAGEPVPNPHTRWLLGPFGTVAIDSLIHLRALRELIIVVPNATSRYGAGTFYTNSAAAGQWETFITRDLVGYVDKRYRTLARSASRGIAGGSGGGYGAFKLAMKRPDLFGAVYAQSPCCLGRAALAYDEQAWRAALRLTRPDQVPDAAHPQAMLLLGLAAAFSPDPHRPPFFVTWPFELVSGVRRPVEPAYSRWLANLPLEVLPRYASNLRRLRGIAFDVGRADQYAFIPITCRELDRALTAIGVPHVFEEYEGDHTNHRRERTVTRLLPFFEATLAFGDSAQERGRAN